MEIVDFFAMQQQLAAANRLMVHDVAVRVLADVGVAEPRFIAGDFGKGILQLDLAVARSFDFGAGKDQSGFDAIRKIVMMTGGPVIAQDFDFRFHVRNPNCVNNL